MVKVQEPNTVSGVRTATPARRYSTAVKFRDKAVDRDEAPTTVEIFSVGNNWYCTVRCGDERTRPIGPYTRRQAERIQDTRRMLIAKRGTARLTFE